MILPFHILHVLPLWQVRMNASPTGGIEQAKTILRRFPQWIDQSINDGFSSATLESMGCLVEYVGSDDGSTSDEYDVLQLHVSFLLKFVKHVHRFWQYHDAIPYCCNVFLDMNTSSDRELGEQVLNAMKKQWEFIVASEKKFAPFLKEIHFIRWQAFREIHTLAEEEGYKLTPKFLALIASYFPGRQNTIGLEHTFGSLRDCETRHSKHKQGSNAQISATAIRTTNNLFEEEAQIVEVTPSMIAQVPAAYSQAILKKDCMNPCKTAMGECGLTNANEIIRTAESRTSAFLLVQNSLSKLKAFQIADEQDDASTDYLWVSGLIPEGTVPLMN